MNLVSIIIPVYNAEETLAQCLDSCIHQTYPNIEVIAVNDGSRDSSLEIAYQYQQKDSRIRVFTQENKGQSFARNVGLANCSGDYVLFLDSDDWLDENCVEIVYSKMNADPSVDFVLFGFNVHQNGKLLRTPNPGDFSFKYGDSFEKFLPIKKLMASPCNKFFKRTYITETFPSDITYAEDVIFNYLNFKPGTNITCICNCLYNVRLNTTSGVNNRYFPNKLEHCIYGCTVNEQSLKAYFGDINVSEIRKGALSSIMSVVVTIASVAGYKTFCEELAGAYGKAHFVEVIHTKCSAKAYLKVLAFLFRHRMKRLAYWYCLFLAYMRKRISARR